MSLNLVDSVSSNPNFRSITWLPSSEADLSRLYCVVKRSHYTNPTAQLGVGGGASWSGPKTLLEDPDLSHAMAFILQNAQKLLGIPHQELDICAWGNILRQTGYIGVHDHDDGSVLLAGILYITRGRIRVYIDGVPTNYDMTPGEVLFLHPKLKHEVKPVEEERVSIAFNIQRAQTARI